jgi:methylisocitrate lyase
MGYRMVIWPVSALRMAAKAQDALYAALRRDGVVKSVVPQMMTRQELYALIGYGEYEALDSSIIKTVIPQQPVDSPNG